MTDIETGENGEKIVKLDYPFDWGDERIASVTIPRIKAMHMRGINGKALESGDMDEMLKLLQNLIGNGTKFINNIDMADIQKIGMVLNDFFPSGPMTGGTA